MKLIKISIVSPVHNRKAETLQWLRSLALLDADGYEIRVVVVDDGSTDGTAEAVRESFPETEIVTGDGNLWFTGGTNRGIEAALKHNPDFILTCNNDTIFEQRSLKAMVDCAIKYPRSVVGPLLLNWEVPHKIFQVSPKWGMRYGGYRHWRNQTVWTVPLTPWEVDIIVGNCVLMPSAAVREAGLMDEKRFVHYGDAEYTPRMRKLGWRLLIEPRARIFCKPNDAPDRFRSLSLSNKLNALFTKTPNAHSIWRRYYMNIAAGPNYLQGLLATPMFYVRYLLGRNLEGEWAEKQPEPPLSETFADRVVND